MVSIHERARAVHVPAFVYNPPSDRTTFINLVAIGTAVDDKILLSNLSERQWMDLL